MAKLDSHTPSIKLRPATRNDAVHILRVNHDATQTMSADHYDRRVLDAWSPVSAERLAQIEKHIEASPDQGMVLVAEIERRIAGFGRVVFSTGELSSLYVSPDASGKGVGKKIMTELENAACAKGLVSLWLNASMNARSFYKSCGFAGDEQVKYELPGGVVMLVIRMHKQLVCVRAGID